jgi:hypothetical protein
MLRKHRNHTAWQQCRKVSEFLGCGLQSLSKPLLHSCTVRYSISSITIVRLGFALPHLNDTEYNQIPGCSVQAVRIAWRHTPVFMLLPQFSLQLQHQVALPSTVIWPWIVKCPRHHSTDILFQGLPRRLPALAAVFTGKLIITIPSCTPLIDRPFLPATGGQAFYRGWRLGSRALVGSWEP